MTLTAVLARIGLVPTADDISTGAYDAARKMLIDTLGCALAGWNAPGVCEVAGQMRDWGGKPEARALVHGDRLPAPNAVFVNSAMIHALDYDDIHLPASLHITSIVVPAVLAVSEMTRATGREALAAFIMGVEVAGRLGIAYQRRRQGPQGSGFLPSSVVGGFGAVAAVARLLGMDTNTCVHAMGLNYAQTSGNRQALHDKTLAKRLQPAFAARSALWACILAARGVTGPCHALEGRAGLFPVYLTAEPPSEDELRQPRVRYEIERLSVKRYTSCGACHTAQAAAEELAREESLRAEEIARVELYGVGPGGLVGNPFHIGPNPQVDAQFSVQYAVAYALLRGRATLQSFTQEAVLADAEVLDLARRCEFIADLDGIPPPPDAPPDCPGHALRYHAVVVHTRDGRRLRRGRYPIQVIGSDVFPEEQVIAKFRDCAAFSGRCPPERADAVLDAIAGLVDAASVQPLMEAMCFDAAG